MNELFAAVSDLDGQENYVYTTGNRAKAFANWCPRIDGFICKLGKEDGRAETLLEKPVITLREAAAKKVNVLIVHTVWHTLYDEVLSWVERERIYLHNDSYAPTNEACIVCGHVGVLHGRGNFFPFLQERMFLGNPPATSMAYCPDCGSCYSSYRPTDEEINRLYSGYRDDAYLKQRQKFEPSYTAEFNRSLSGGTTVPKERMGWRRF